MTATGHKRAFPEDGPMSEKAANLAIQLTAYTRTSCQKRLFKLIHSNNKGIQGMNLAVNGIP